MFSDLIPNDWRDFLKEEIQKDYFKELEKNYLRIKNNGAIIYPPENLIFNAFSLTPLNSVKVILLGQDPYFKEGQAMGLSFSVPKNIKIPPSLKNIFKELKADLNIAIKENGDLSPWAKSGVLLCNAILTVEKDSPLKHKNFGWETFTDALIFKLSKEKENLVFLLWGKFAQSKKHLIDDEKHLVLEAAHPSPLARVGFLGCRHFSKANAYLREHGKTPIEW